MGGGPKEQPRLRVGGSDCTQPYVGRTTDTWPAVYFTTICSLGFGALTAATAIRPRTESRSPSGLADYRLLTGLGLGSYGIYLWHEPILLALNDWGGLVRQTPNAFVQDTGVVLAISIAAGGLSYLLVQRPADQLLRIFGTVAQQDILPTVLELSSQPDDPDDMTRDDPTTPNPIGVRHLTLLPDGRRRARSSYRRSTDETCD